MKPKAPFISVKRIFILGATCASFPTLAQQFPIDTTKFNPLNEVVVTATRTATERAKTPHRIEVISQQDIEKTPALEFTDLLKKNASVNVIQYPGLSAGVSIRGFRPQFSGLNQRTLLLVDGRPAGTVNIATINPADIERVEVLKGPASALYGSQAMGGVVNVITRKSRGEIRSSVFAEYGSYETFKAGAVTGGNITDRLDYDLSFTTFDRSQNMRLGQGNLFRKLLKAEQVTKFYPEGTQTEDDRRGDGLRREHSRLNHGTGSLRLGYQLNPSWRVDVKGERFVAKNIEAPSDIAYGNASPNSKDISRANGELSVSGQLRDHQLFVRGYTAQENDDYINLVSGGVPIPPYLSLQTTSAWQGLQLKDVFPIGQHTVIAGLDYNHAASTSRVFNSAKSEMSPYSPNYSLASAAAYVQGQLRFFQEKLVVNPGARYDLISYHVQETPLLSTHSPGRETNRFFSPSLAVQYQVLNPLTVHATIGRAFVTPSAFQVAGYSESIGSNGLASVARGNPNLRNENSTTWDAGIRWENRESGFSADLTYFHTTVLDRISNRWTNLSQDSIAQYSRNGNQMGSLMTYINADKARIRGLEMEIGYDFGSRRDFRYLLRIFASATTNLRAEETTIGENQTETARDIYNVADLTMNYGLDYDNYKGFRARLQGRYVGHRKDTDFNDYPRYPEIEYPAFMVLDVSASYTYARKHTLAVLLNNLTDENYYEVRGFNLPGRNVTLRYGLTF